MRKDNGIERFRIAGNSSFGNNGHFLLRGPSGDDLLCIVSDGCGWDHVSVSVRSRIIGATAPSRLPNWTEMSFVKRFFFADDELAVQYHPPLKDNVSNHEVLHLWRSQDVAYPMPPIGMIGVREPEGGDGETVVTLQFGKEETEMIRTLAGRAGCTEEAAFQELVNSALRMLKKHMADPIVDSYERATA